MLSTAALLALTLSAGPEPLRSVVLKGFTHVEQKPDFCGEAAAEMALRRLGREVSQDQVFARSGVDPALGRGVWTNELATALKALGIDPGPVWTKVDPKKAEAEIDAQFRALVGDLAQGEPSIVCMHSDDSPSTTEHFRLVTGYDAEKDEVVYQEPAEKNGADRRMKRGDFLALWTFKTKPERWSLIRLRIHPNGSAPALEAEATPHRADVSQRAQQLRAELPAGFTLAYEAPFLVIGNEAPATVRQRAKGIVRRTSELLLKDFFPSAPAALHEVWLFKDKPTYERASRQRWHLEPETPYGYYLSSQRALVMNIGPGYGTLTHELVHPFMHEAWPEAPGWLNEGLASLFEQPGERDGHLVGGVNWRLPGLKAALAAKAVPSFRALTALDHEGFYDDDTGVHYAAARYLVYWLQEKGLLHAFIAKALAQKSKDPTAYRALEEVLGQSPERARPEWETFVKALERKPAS